MARITLRPRKGGREGADRRSLEDRENRKGSGGVEFGHRAAVRQRV
jgi:hypothetical protein